MKTQHKIINGVKIILFPNEPPVYQLLSSMDGQSITEWKAKNKSAIKEFIQSVNPDALNVHKKRKKIKSKSKLISHYMP